MKGIAVNFLHAKGHVLAEFTKLRFVPEMHDCVDLTLGGETATYKVGRRVYDLSTGQVNITLFPTFPGGINELNSAEVGGQMTLMKRAIKALGLDEVNDNWYSVIETLEEATRARRGA